jgi:CubicO group peptidase (beta-lactamase class C family)
VQLLSHTSGIPSDTEAHEKLIKQSFTLEKRNLDELCYWVIQQLVSQPLQSKPGTQFAYANMGYMLAGAMLERVTGRTWEELIVERVFEPLGLKSAGLGPQSTLGRVDAPLGHEARDGQVHPHAADRVLDAMLGVGGSGAPAMIMAVVVVMLVMVVVAVMHAMARLIASCATPAARCLRLLVCVSRMNGAVVGHRGLLDVDLT